MKKLLLAAIVSLMIISLASTANAEPLIIESFHGASYSDRSDVLRFSHYNNTLSGEINYNSKLVTFSNVSIIQYADSFKARDTENNLIITGDNPVISKSNIRVLFLDDKRIINFYIVENNEKFITIPKIIVPDVTKSDAYLALDKKPLEEILTEYYQKLDEINTINIPKGNYSNILIDIIPVDNSTKINVKLLNPADYGKLGELIKIQGYVVNSRTGETITDATLQYEISRRDSIIATHLIENDGFFTMYHNLGYPEFYPGHCYEIKFTTMYNNATGVKVEDFKVKKGSTSYYNDRVNLDWLDEPKYDSLPQEYRVLDREILKSDMECN